MSEGISNYASPVSSPPFKYTTDNFWVEVEGQRYNRRDPTSLYQLLTYVDSGPAYTKKGKLRVRQPKPLVDETENFYLAQLLHYGLQPQKTKEAAKDALLAAFKNQKSPLTVPENVLEVERDLEDKYWFKKRGGVSPGTNEVQEDRKRNREET